ncbi:MAG: hypothetical protein LBF21_02135, partial [Puniceicoccales bacterium]|nr:hypothetical protein [Puniceicoccales bacterium]
MTFFGADAGPALQGVKMMGNIIFIPCGPLCGPDAGGIESRPQKNTPFSVKNVRIFSRVHFFLQGNPDTFRK